MKKVKKKSSFMTFLLKYKKESIIKSIVIGAVFLNILFLRYIWNPYKKTWANAVAAFICELFLLSIFIFIALLLMVLIDDIMSISRFRYLPLDDDEIKNNELDTVKKYVDFVGDIQKRKHFIGKIFPGYPPFPEDLQKEILSCIARIYSEDEIFNYLQNDSNLEKWKDMFWFKTCECIPEIFYKGIKKEKIFIGERDYKNKYISYYIKNRKIITQTERFFRY